MRKSNLRLRIGIHCLNIVLSTAMLYIFRNIIKEAAPSLKLYIYADYMIIIFFACMALTLAFNVVSTLKERQRDKNDRADMQKLRERALTDSLTGLYNRETAIEMITDYLKLEKRSKRHALMVIDLDNFKDVNDCFGHFEGDKVLQALSEKIRAVFGPGDIVGRLGGDEFIILLKEAPSRIDVKRKALELQNALEYMTSGGDVTVTVTGSIGISYTDDDSGKRKSFDQLYKEADEAVYKSKLAGKNRYYFFDEKLPAQPDGAADQPVLTVSSAGIELKALIDNIDGGIALLEIDQKIRSIYLSRSYVRMMNLSYEGIKRADNCALSFIHPEDRIPVEELLREGAVSGLPSESVFRRQTKSGAAKWYHMRAVRISYEYSNKPVMIAIVTDVTNLKETELKYQAQKMQLETVLRVSHVVTFEVDIRTRSLHITEPTVIKYGLDTHVIENMPEALIDIGVIHPDSVDECRRMYDEIYSGIQESSAVIKTLLREGVYTIERFTYFSVYDDCGQPIKAVGISESMESSTDKLLRVALLEKQFRYHADNMLSVVKFALSKNDLETLTTTPGITSCENGCQTYTEFIRDILESAAEPADRAFIEKTFSIDGLRVNWALNKTYLCYEYRAVSSGNGEIWRFIAAGLYKNELDGEVYGFVRLRDTTGKRALEDETGIRLEPGEMGMLYSYEKLRQVGDIILSSRRGWTGCALVLLEMTNYNDILIKHGQLLMDGLITGFTGKVLMMLKPEHLVSNKHEGSLVIVMTDVTSASDVKTLMEAILKFLRDPAYFQFKEELYLEYKYAIALPDEGTAGLDMMYNNAKRVLQEDRQSLSN